MSKQTYHTFRQSMLDQTDDWKDLLADDVKLVGPLAAVEGRDAFIEVNTPFFASIQESQLHELVEDGNRIITQITTIVTAPDGEPLALPVSEWYEFAEGKLTSLRVFFDTAEFRKRFGMER